MFIITMFPEYLCRGFYWKSLDPFVYVFNKDCNSLAFQVGMKKYVDLRIFNDMFTHIMFAGVDKDFDVNCCLLDHFNGNRSVVVGLSCQDTEGE